MDVEQSDVQNEIQRRASIYAERDDGGKAAGAMSAVDYIVLFILVISLVVGFCLWGQ